MRTLFSYLRWRFSASRRPTLFGAALAIAGNVLAVAGAAFRIETEVAAVWALVLMVLGSALMFGGWLLALGGFTKTSFTGESLILGLMEAVLVVMLGVGLPTAVFVVVAVALQLLVGIGWVHRGGHRILTDRVTFASADLPDDVWVTDEVGGQWRRMGSTNPRHRLTFAHVAPDSPGVVAYQAWSSLSSSRRGFSRYSVDQFEPDADIDNVLEQLQPQRRVIPAGELLELYRQLARRTPARPEPI